MEAMGGSNDRKGLLEYVRKTTPPQFLLKTYMLVEDLATDHVISWNGDGTGFVVWQPAEFARDLLPTLFKHSNFSSFVRQLNTYGFRKVATSRWEFCNDKFRKGERDLLCQIRRRKAWSSSSSSSSNNNNEQQQKPNNIGPIINPNDHHQFDEEDQRSSSTSSLIHENKRLKKENGVLSTELTSMKRKCKELLNLVAKYAINLDHKGGERDQNDDERPKLFGVRLEVEGQKEKKKKRNRSEIRECAGILLRQSCK